ncbi:hypothetical protein NSS91_09865 [Caldifermentibacillus hisashii]|uniref:hypothetical protein n=1 Tax=Caldifermentibacillus hisashii TaxID=996558 RepID=UPI0031011519
MKNEKSSIVCSGIEVPITYIQQETETTYLAIFLPGKGYTAQKPLQIFKTRKPIVFRHGMIALCKKAGDFFAPGLSIN